MKKIIFLLIIAAVTLPITVLAQTVERQVIGTTGGWNTGTGIQVSSTVGEVMISTGTSAGITLSHGFQQSGKAGTLSIEDPQTGLSIKVSAFPNPVMGIVTLQLSAPGHMELIMSVFDINGQDISLPVSNLQVSGETVTHQVDFSAMPIGKYFIVLQNSDSNLKQTIEVVKVE